MEVFQNNEKGYFTWLEVNPSGLVINVPKSKSATHLVLHKANCHHISKTNREEGAFTTRQYYKVCGNAPKELESWIIENRKTFSGQLYECKACNPSVSKIAIPER